MVSSVLSDGRMGMDLSNAHEDRYELVVGGDIQALGWLWIVAQSY